MMVAFWGCLSKIELLSSSAVSNAAVGMVLSTTQHSSSSTSVGGIFSGGEEGWLGSDGLSSDDHQLKTIIYQCCGVGWCCCWDLLLLLYSCWISTWYCNHFFFGQNLIKLSQTKSIIKLTLKNWDETCSIEVIVICKSTHFGLYFGFKFKPQAQVFESFITNHLKFPFLLGTFTRIIQIEIVGGLLNEKSWSLQLKLNEYEMQRIFYYIVLFKSLSGYIPISYILDST